MILAHEQWFVDAAITKPITQDRLLALVTVPHMIILAIAAAIFIFLAIEEDRARRERWQKIFAPYLGYAPTILGIAAGAALILLVIVFKAHLAPNLVGEHKLFPWDFVFELVVGIALVVGLLVRPAAVALLVLYGFAAARFGWMEAVSNIYFVGIALYLVVVGRGRWSVGSVLAKFFSVGNDHLIGPITIVFRVLLGANLIFLAAIKIMHPELHHAMLEAYQFNPLAIIQIGLPIVSASWYIFAVAIAEALAGILIMLGIFLRPVALLLAVLFIGSGFFLGTKEIIGHLPIIGACLAFAILGRSGTPPREVR